MTAEQNFENKSVMTALEQLLTVIKKLRNPGGCPWDIKQTPMSLRTTLLEEAYECVEAVEEHDASATAKEHIKEEIGDVLLNVLMMAYMYEQADAFSIAELCDNLGEKLVRRHPHVFGKTAGFAGPESEQKTTSAESVKEQWDTIKEKLEKRQQDSAVDGIPKTFSALMQSQKLQKRAAKKGFDWSSISGVEAKLAEELTELREVLHGDDQARIEDELGDVFFVLVNMARFSKVDPEIALLHANSKFERRFRFVEKKMKGAGIENLTDISDEQALKWWNEAKKTTNF